MSYSIIFETKVVKLSDGRLLYFDRSGCNNDTAGRTRWDFTCQIITEEEYIQRANNYIENGDTHSFDLKIGSRHASYYDYGQHLLRMLKRAVSYADFINERKFIAKMMYEVEVLKPENLKGIYKPEQFDEIFDKLFSVRYSQPTRIIKKFGNIKVINERELVSAIESKVPIELYIGKKTVK